MLSLSSPLLSPTALKALFRLTSEGNTIDPLIYAQYLRCLTPGHSPCSPFHALSTFLPWCAPRSYNDHATTFGTVKGQRNPYWLASGIEAQGQILWSQPEVIIYNKANLNGEGGG